MPYYNFKKMRDINLSLVLESLYQATEAQTNYLHNTRKYLLSSGHHIAVTGLKWIDNKTHAGGFGALDLVMYISSVSLLDAAKSLETLSYSSINNDTFSYAESDHCSIPQPHEPTWRFVRNYLTENRKIPADLVDFLYTSSLVWSDRNRNCVFPRDFNSGAYLRGTLSGIPFKQTIGRNGFPYVIPGDDLIIITEAPIDAISLRYYHPNATVLATGGRIGFNKINPYLAKACKVLLAQDNDKAGEEQAIIFQKAIKVKTERLLPMWNLKDWNETLKMEMIYLKT
jgi:hypothetical protein